MTTWADLQDVEFWKNRLVQIEDELGEMIGSVGGIVSNMSFDQKEAYDRLISEQTRVQTKVTQLTSGTTTAAKFSQATHSQYEV